MIVDLGVYIFALLLDIISFFLPTFSVWPSSLLTGLTYFTHSLAKLNFIVPVDILFQAISFFILFETAYFTVKLLLKFIGFFRKSESLNL